MVDRVQEKSHRRSDRLRGFLNAIPDLLFVLDEDGRYVEVLGSDQALLYAEARRLLGRRMHEVLPKSKADQFLRTVKKTLRSGRSQILEYQLEVPAGLRSFEGRTAPLRDRVQGRGTVVWVSRDITERKHLEARLRSQMSETRKAYQELRRAQAQLIRSEKFALIGALLAGVAHELNNPLNVIYGNLELLSGILGASKAGASLFGGAKARQMLQDALAAGKRARSAMLQFRTFARDPRDAEFADVNGCLEEAADYVFREGHARIGLVKRLVRPARVPCFLNQLRVLFTNLIRNAAEACGGRGTVTLTSRSVGRTVVVEVSDTGRGIPKEHRKHLFQPFFTTKRPGQGLGLGLAIGAMIVDQHKGRIVCRTRVGKGTTFRVTLPVGPAAVGPRMVRSSHPGAGTR